MIHVAEFNSGQIRLEISNQAEFIRAVKQAARDAKRRKLHGEWRIRLIGSDKITAPVQKLIDDLGQNLNGDLAKADSELAAGETISTEELRETLNIPAEKPVRPRPGGPLKSD